MIVMDRGHSRIEIQVSHWERCHGFYFVGQYVILDAWNGPQIKHFLTEGKIIHHTVS